MNPVHDPAAAPGEANAPSVLSERLARIIRVHEVRAPDPALVLPFDGQNPRAAEQYRIIRTKILLSLRPVHLLAVSSPQIGDGKSVTALNVAGALALKLGRPVLLVDADFRRYGLSRLLGLESSPGLSDVLTGGCSLTEALGRLDAVANLYFLPAGTRREHLADLLNFAAWRALCGELRKVYHTVLFDAPPVGLVADYDLIQAVADGLILVVRPDHTGRTMCRRALESVPEEKLLGVVLNMVPDWFLTRRRTHDYAHYAGRVAAPGS